MNVAGLIKEFLLFLRERRVWWMTPILVVLLLLAAFIVLAETSPVLPFIYPLF